MKSFTTHFLGTSLSLLLLGACAASNGAKSSDQIVRPLGDEVTIMEYSGGKITAKDVKEVVNPQIKRFNGESIEAYQQAAQRILTEELIEAEAKAKNTTPQALFDNLAPSGEVTDSEFETFVKARPDLQKGLKEGMKDPRTGKVQKVSKEEIKKFLGQQRSQQVQQSFVQGLVSKAKSKMVLDLPRVEIPSLSSDAYFGSKDAKVTIHEFSDFQCPYCAKALPMVQQIKETFGDKVKFVFKHFPLSFHEHARPAALATICAKEQGKFWELHDRIFENQNSFNTEAPKDPIKGVELIKKWAKSVGIDTAKLESCMALAKTSETLKLDLDIAEKIGVNGTPAFFVNGKKVQVGSFEEFRVVVEQELSK